MKKLIIIIFLFFFVRTIGFAINGSNPMEFINCYINVIKKAIEDQKWNLDLLEGDSLCSDYFLAHDFVIDKDTLRIIPKDYSENKYRLKTFLFSDSIAIVQFQIDTVIVNDNRFYRKKHKRKKSESHLEFNVILDSSNETGVRVNFGHPILPHDKNKGKRDT